MIQQPRRNEGTCLLMVIASMLQVVLHSYCGNYSSCAAWLFVALLAIEKAKDEEAFAGLLILANRAQDGWDLASNRNAELRAHVRKILGGLR